MSELLNLNRLVYFTNVVDTGSFTIAGERLGVAKAVVSHQVSKLEQELGVTLLTRTTRRVRTTEEGRLFYDHCTMILREAEAAYGEMSQRTAEPSGTLNLTAPLDYGAAIVAPVVAAYRNLYPQVRINIVFDDTVVDLAEGQIDVAIRVGWLLDSSHRARRLGSFVQHVVATPSFAATLPENLHPEDAGNLPWVANAALRNPLQWMFSRPGRDPVVIDARAAVTADKTPATHACVLAGAGISVLPDFLVADDLAAGRLVRLLPEWTLPSGDIHAVYPVGRFRPARVRTFVDMLVTAERERHQSA